MAGGGSSCGGTQTVARRTAGRDWAASGPLGGQARAAVFPAGVFRGAGLRAAGFVAAGLARPPARAVGWDPVGSSVSTFGSSSGVGVDSAAISWKMTLQCSLSDSWPMNRPRWPPVEDWRPIPGRRGRDVVGQRPDLVGGGDVVGLAGHEEQRTVDGRKVDVLPVDDQIARDERVAQEQVLDDPEVEGPRQVLGPSNQSSNCQ